MAKKPGRPSKFTKELANDICERLASGESLRTICMAEGMPGERTVYTWLLDDEAFQQQYARAREAQADALVEEIREIADDGSNDWMEVRLKSGEVKVVLDQEHVQRSRLRIDTRKWLMSKMAPKKYGDKMQHTGADGEGPVEVVVSDLEFARRTAFMLAKGVKQDKKD